MGLFGVSMELKFGVYNYDEFHRSPSKARKGNAFIERKYNLWRWGL